MTNASLRHSKFVITFPIRLKRDKLPDLGETFPLSLEDCISKETATCPTLLVS